MESFLEVMMLNCISTSEPLSKGRRKGCSRQWLFHIVKKGSGLKVIKGYEESESEFPSLMTIDSWQIIFLLNIYFLIGSVRENERAKEKEHLAACKYSICCVLSVNFCDVLGDYNCFYISGVQRFKWSSDNQDRKES